MCQKRGNRDVSCSVSEEIQNSSKWYDMRNERAFESPEGTECFLTVSWFVKIYCYVEDVQDDKAFLQKCMFSFCFYGRKLIFR